MCIKVRHVERGHARHHDPDGIFAAIMVGLYPNLSSSERRDKLTDHAEWGIREIYRKEKIGTLNFATLGLT